MTVAAVAATVAEADAAASPLSLKDYPQIITSVSGQQYQKRQDTLQKRAKSFWIEDIEHTGKIPYGTDNTEYKVFRNVMDYGAIGDGVIDDTDAINKAMPEGDSCGEKIESSSLREPSSIFHPASICVCTLTLSVGKYH